MPAVTIPPLRPGPRMFSRATGIDAGRRQAYLKAPNAESNDYFGVSVAASGTTVVVGASHESSSQTSVTNGATASADNSAANSGAGYVFAYR